jgi:glycosyltransferase involved in cell wall biosynthesis
MSYKNDEIRTNDSGRHRTMLVFSSTTDESFYQFIAEHLISNLGYASLNYSRNFVNAVSRNYDNCYLVSTPPIGSFPNHSTIALFKGFPTKSNIVAPKFCNLWGIRNISSTLSMNSAFNNEIRPLIRDDELVDIFAIEAHTPFISAGVYAKHHLRNSTLSLVVLDLPTAMNPLKHSFIYDFAKSIDNYKILNLCRNVDGYVYLTENMKEYFLPNGRPYAVQEGIIDYQSITNCTNQSIPGRVVYSGTLSPDYSGLSTIVSAAKILERTPSVEFILAGAGDTQLVRNSIKNSSNIRFVGSLSSEDTRRLQRTASVLINPRPNMKKYAYSFPSKLLEYISTCHPTISYKLPCIPKEYDNVLIYPKDETPESFADAIEFALGLSSMEKKELASRSLSLLRKKTPQYLGSIVDDLVNKERSHLALKSGN